MLRFGRVAADGLAVGCDGPPVQFRNRSIDQPVCKMSERSSRLGEVGASVHIAPDNVQHGRITQPSEQSFETLDVVDRRQPITDRVSERRLAIVPGFEKVDECIGMGHRHGAREFAQRERSRQLLHLVGMDRKPRVDTRREIRIETFSKSTPCHPCRVGEG